MGYEMENDMGRVRYRGVRKEQEHSSLVALKRETSKHQFTATDQGGLTSLTASRNVEMFGFFVIA